MSVKEVAGAILAVIGFMLIGMIALLVCFLPLLIVIGIVVSLKSYWHLFWLIVAIPMTVGLLAILSTSLKEEDRK